MIIDSFEQNTDEWLQARIGSIGGSGINFVATNGKGHDDYLIKKAGELLSKVPGKNPNVWQFERGKTFEPAARKYYQMKKRTIVQQIGMARHDEFKHYSADGLVEPDGFIEIKIREVEVFLKMRLDKNQSLATNERRQIQWGFRVMPERKWCDHIDFCPELEKAGIVDPAIIKRIHPDEKEIKALDEGCDAFIKEILLLIKKVKGV